jgi:flagellar motility protein MotE (MotC chaperone)
MKWPLCVTKIGIPKLFKSLIILASFKILLLGVWGIQTIWLPATQGTPKTENLVNKSNPEQPQAPAPNPLDTSKLAHAQENQQSSSESASNLSKERKELLERKKKLDRKEKELKQLEKELDQKLNKMKKTEQRLKQLIEEADALKDEKIKHLVDVYANMKPKRAAQVLETISEDIAVKILSGMRGRQAGEILSHVNSKKAATLSEALTEMQTPFAN